MKTLSVRHSLLRPCVLGCAILLLGGCLQERLAWSPDGKHAAVVTAEGLHLADASGRISPLLVPGAYRVAWLADSQRLVLARKKPLKNFAEIAAALGPERTRTLVTKAETVWSELKDLPRTEEFNKRAGENCGDDLAGIVAYLREQPKHLAALREKLGSDWKKEDETKPVELNEVLIARVVGSTLELGASLWVGLPGVNVLRPAPGGTALAFTRQAELSLHPDNSICVLVVPTDASSSAVVAATQSTTHPDWSQDGRALVFFKASGGAGQTDDLRLGALVKRTVLDSAGRINLANESTDLAGLVHHKQNRVRCLRDGRILFNAIPITLPTTGGGEKVHEQLFLSSKEPAAPLRPVISTAQLDQLPNSLSVFEVSPDETQVLIADDNGAVWLLALATGSFERITGKLESDKGRGEGESYPAPAWRGPGEFTFLRRREPAAPFELILRRGDAETVLSRDWDATVLRRLIE